MTSDNDNTSGMTSSQPYLIRAIYEWIVDNELTPYLMVDATKRGAIVPEDYLDELGRIILNISPSATSGLLMTNEEITFSARFSGQSMTIVVPIYSVRAIYSRENGQGMMFDDASEPSQDVSKKRATLEAVGNTRVSSDIVSDSVDNDNVDPSEISASDERPDQSSGQSDNQSNNQSVDQSHGKSSPDKPRPAPKKGKKGGPHLKVVK